MADKAQRSNEQMRVTAAEELWLGYFNQYLFESGLITEQQRNRINARIIARPKRSVGKTAYGERAAGYEQQR